MAYVYTAHQSTMRAIIRSLAQVPFVRDLLALQIGGVVAIGINLLTSIVYARVLGLQGYGVYAVVLAYTGTAGILLNWGQISALMTFFAEEYGKKDTKGMGTVLGYYLSVTALTSVLMLAFAWISPLFSSHIYANPQIGSLAQLAFGAMILNTIPAFFYAILQTVREIKLLAVVDQTTSLLQAGVCAAMVLLGKGVAGIFLGVITFQLLALPFYMELYRRLRKRYLLPSLRECFTLRGRKWREYLGQGIWIGIDKNIGNLFPKSFLFILSTFTAPATVGLARIMFQLSGLPDMVLFNQAGQMASSILPTIAQKGRDTLRKNALRLLKHTVFFHTLISIAAAAAMPIVIPLLFSTKYDKAILPAVVLTLISIIPAFGVNDTALLRYFRRTYVSSAINALALLLCCGAFLLLINLVSPLQALIGVTTLFYLCNLSITWYIYGWLLTPKTTLASA